MLAKGKKALLVLLLLGSLPAAGAADGGESLAMEESVGYLQWLHSLEKAVQGRTASGVPEGNLLFPLGRPGWVEPETRPYRHLTISKAIGVLESQYAVRANVPSALVALANARNYLNLSEFDSALVWYDLAADLDSAGTFAAEIELESMSAAVAGNDSLAMASLVMETWTRVDDPASVENVCLAIRWTLSRGTSDQAAGLTDLLADLPEDMDPVLRFWRAYASSFNGNRAGSLADLRILIRAGGLSLGLSEGQRAWVLTALADEVFLAGNHDQARSLYETLKESNLEELRLWGTYQLAGLAFIACSYLEAATGFETVCKANQVAIWQKQACEMADLAGELSRIHKEGEPYGVAGFYAR